MLKEIQREKRGENPIKSASFGCRNLDAAFSFNKYLSHFNATSRFSLPILAMSSSYSLDLAPSFFASPTRKQGFCRRIFGLDVLRFGSTKSRSLCLAKINRDCDPNSGKNHPLMSTVGKSTNIVWQDCPVGKLERQKLLKQKGCVIWITGLSGSGKSTLACALSRELHNMGYLSYVLDGDNIRHGLNRDLSFKAEDRAENIRRVGEVAKLFADAGVICIASLISPYRRDRDACRALLPDSNFIEIFMDMPIEVCESRDPKGLYKLALAGKIKDFTGVDDPYERPLNCEIVMRSRDGVRDSPTAMAEQIISYLNLHGFLKAQRQR